MKGMREVSRRGFTLLEVLVALAVSGVVVLGARMMLVQLADENDRLLGAATAADRRANAERLLRALVGQLEVGTSKGTEFEGEERITRFTSWCRVPAGWLERCRAAIAVDSLGSSPALVAVLSTGEVIPLFSGFERGALR
jgi:prepilin-type N-terminal cleavage/methylation domain-containing protein